MPKGCAAGCLKVTITLDEKLHKRVKKKILKRYGLKRGGVSRAAEEAFKDWLKK